MRAHEIMSRHVITIGADAPVIDALKTLMSYRISGLPVVDCGGRLVGILSEGDFLRRVEIGTEKRRSPWLTLLAGADQAALDFARQHGRTVREIMTPDPITVGEDTTLEQIVRLMEARNVGRFPVMRGDTIVGIVTRGDFLAAVASLWLDRHGTSGVDDDIRASVVAAMSQASWRPCALNVGVRDGVVTLKGTIKSESARKAAIIASENVPGVKRVDDQLVRMARPAAEEDYGGGDFVSLQEETSSVDDEPL